MNFIEFSWILINCGFYGNQRNSGLALYLKMPVLVTSISVPNFMLISKSAQFTWNFELIAARLEEETAPRPRTTTWTVEMKGGYGYSSLLLLNRNQFSSCKCRELQWLHVQRHQQDTLRRFCQPLCSSNAMKWVKVWLLPPKPCLFSLNTFLNSW